MKFISAVLLLVIVTLANAGPPILIDPQTGKYLGNLSTNQYDPNSTSNPYGQYGSEYSPDSINNPYGQYDPCAFGKKPVTNDYFLSTNQSLMTAFTPVNINR